MRTRAATIIFALATPCAFSQLTIENPRHVDIPEAQARVLFQMSFHAVAKELRLGQTTNAEFPLHLVIGQGEERFGLDARTGVATLLLREWDALKFTTAAVKFAIQRSVQPEREEAMISEIVRHSQAVAPVSAAQLRGSNQVGDPLPPPAIGCVKGIYDAGLSGSPCAMAPGSRSGPVR